MADTARIGSALVAGYLLGRTKKAKKAITLALWLTGKNKMLQPQNLAKMALTKLQDSPVAGEIITQIRGPLATAASKAALATLESRATAFADSLHEKTLALQPPGAEDAEADEDEAADPALRSVRRRTRRRRHTLARFHPIRSSYRSTASRTSSMWSPPNLSR